MELKSRTRSILVLYDAGSLDTEFVRQHLMAFKRHSRHNVAYAHATFDSKADFPLELFDAVVIHFSVRMPYETMSPVFVDLVSSFRGPKILLIQDEYDMPRKACVLIRQLGIQTLFTTVPPAFLRDFYPPDELPGVVFRSCLTGYIPDELPVELVKPISDRAIWLGYRGRKIPVWYGQLALEKFSITKSMKAECVARHIPHDIESEEHKRINGPAWFEFMLSTRAMLGTESGSNVLDAWGHIRRDVQILSSKRPDLSEAELYERVVAPHENNVRMNQISPKIFESIALKTALVLFEGTYSNIIKPNEHFIVLRKDYGNVDDVLRQLADTKTLQKMVDRAYEDIVLSGAYSYSQFVKEIDDAVEGTENLGPLRKQRQIFALVRSESQGAALWEANAPNLPTSAPISYKPIPAYKPILSGKARDLWLFLPAWLRYSIAACSGSTLQRLRALYLSRYC
jgi:hypothetical protein